MFFKVIIKHTFKVCLVAILGSSFSLKNVFEKKKKVFGKI